MYEFLTYIAERNIREVNPELSIAIPSIHC